MDGGWVLLALIGSSLAVMFAYVLLRMAGKQDRSARHEERTLDPFSDVTITRQNV